MSEEKCENVSCKRYRMVPPDGGWGYMICLACIINFSTTTSFAASFGMLFKDYFIEIQMSSTNVALMAGINAMAGAFAGFLAGSLLKIMSFRKVAFLAATLYNVGIFSVVFIKSQVLFVLCQGIMPAAGLGLLYSLSMTILNDYFVTKRLFANSVVQTVTAVTAMVGPMFISWSSETYGHCGTLLLISGICSHIFLAVILMQPVKWHMKRIEIPNDEQEAQILLVESKPDKVPVVKLTDIEEPVKKEADEKSIEDVNIKATKSAFMKFVSSIIDISLTKTFLVSCSGLCPAMAMSLDTTYSLMLPQALYSIDWSQDDVAWALSLCGFGDLAMRILLVFFSSYIMKIGCQEVYVIGIAVGFVVRLGIQWTHNFGVTLLLITLMGFSRCIIAVMLPIVIGDVVRPEQFTAALGLSLIVLGLSNLLLSPAIGAVQDLTKSYATAFYLTTSMYAILVLFWSIELLYKKNKHKHVPRNKSSKSKVNK